MRSSAVRRLSFAGVPQVLIVHLPGSLQTITGKLGVLLELMSTKPGQHDAPGAPTPLQRLQLLREVTEDAKIFRLGGEDKVRVASGTCETVRGPPPC